MCARVSVPFHISLPKHMSFYYVFASFSFLLQFHFIFYHVFFFVCSFYSVCVYYYYHYFILHLSPIRPQKHNTPNYSLLLQNRFVFFCVFLVENIWTHTHTLLCSPHMMCTQAVYHFSTSILFGFKTKLRKIYEFKSDEEKKSVK